MKTYRYQFPNGHNEDGSTIVGEEFLTETEILDKYWEYWVSQMVDRFGPKCDKITQERCIEDWVVVHWAVEVKEDDRVDSL